MTIGDLFIIVVGACIVVITIDLRQLIRSLTLRTEEERARMKEWDGDDVDENDEADWWKRGGERRKDGEG